MGFSEGEGVAFYGVGVVGVVDFEVFVEFLDYGGGGGAVAVEFGFFCEYALVDLVV